MTMNSHTKSKRTRRVAAARNTKSPEALPNMAKVDSWRPTKVGGSQQYVVHTTDGCTGLLRIDTDCACSERSLVANLTSWDGQLQRTYRDAQIELPAGLQKAITEYRLRGVATSLLDSLLDTPDGDNPALKVVAWSTTLRRGFAREELEYLIKDLEDYGEELGVGYQGELDELRRLKADSDVLWANPDERNQGEAK